MITYDPTAFDVPAGTYVGRLNEVLDKPPFEASKFGPSVEPRLAWRFEVVGPPGCPAMGKTIEQGTGTKPTPKSGLVRFLTLLLGRMPTKGERIDPASFVGREYQIMWTVNPKSEQGNLYINSMMPMTAGQPSGTPPPMPAPPGTAAGQRQPVPTPPPPPPPPAPPAANTTVAPIYWIHMPDGKTVEASQATVQGHLDMGQEDENTLKLMDQAQMGLGWKAAAFFGFKKRTPPF